MRPLEPGTGGVIAVAILHGRRRPLAECASCGTTAPISCRGLCGRCFNWHRYHGTLSDYGYTRADRLAEYRQLRPALAVAEAAARVGVSVRTARRYEHALAATGRTT